MNKIAPLILLMLQIELPSVNAQLLNLQQGGSSPKPVLVLKAQKAKMDLPLVLNGHLEQKFQAKRIGHRRRHHRRVWRGRSLVARVAIPKSVVSKPTLKQRVETNVTTAGNTLKLASAAGLKNVKLVTVEKKSDRPDKSLVAKVAVNVVTVKATQTKKKPCSCQKASRLFGDGKYAEAAIAYREYGQALEREFHGVTSDQGSALLWEGYSFYKMKQYRQAKYCWQKSLAIYANSKPNNHSAESVEWLHERLKRLAQRRQA